MHDSGGRLKSGKWQSLTRSGDDGRSITVLYVEDDPASQMLIQQAFSLRPSWKLLLAKSVEEGIRQLQQKLDVVLLDINLPDGRGYELLSHLRADSLLQHIPVIAVTSCAMREQVEEGLNAGFFQYLVKPLDLNHLFVAIETATA